MATSDYFSNEAYFQSLRTDAQFGTSTLYSLFREDSVKALTSFGVEEEEAAYCFRLAVCDAAHWARAGRQPEVDTPLGQILRERSLAHASLRMPHVAPLQREFQLTDGNDLRQSQQKAAVWSALARLQPECRESLLIMPTLEESYCWEALQSELEAKAINPEVVHLALADLEGFRTWQYTGEHERSWQKPATPVASVEGPNRNIWRWAVMAFIVVILAYAAHQFLTRPKTIAELYASNFDPPRSLMADWEQRHVNDSTETPLTEECRMLLREADALYQSGDYRNALDPLLLIVLDTAATCHADAWFYLGIIQLHMKDPTTAMQCFAKIEDLERFGEDIYWYQVMAYMQLAQNSPHQRERIAQAVALAIPNIQSPKRRTQAETLLKNLSP